MHIAFRKKLIKKKQSIIPLHLIYVIIPLSYLSFTAYVCIKDHKHHKITSLHIVEIKIEIIYI